MADPGRYGRLRLASGRERYATLDGDDAHLLDAPPWAGGARTGEVVRVTDAAWLCPVEPRKILGIGKNYRAHAAEMGGDVPTEPLVFLKPPSALVGPGEPVILPRESARVDYEGELAVVVGRRARRLSPETALDAVFGYTTACDVTARDFQKRDGQWARAKGFDTFCPVAPVVVTSLDPGSLAIRLTIDDQLRQSGTTADMVFSVAQLLAHLSSFCTLEPGDLVLTGTPEGVGPLEPGNRVEVCVDGIDPLRFDVVAEPA